MACATMLATTLGIEFDPAKNYDERKEIYRMSGNIVRNPIDADRRGRQTRPVDHGDRGGSIHYVV